MSAEIKVERDLPFAEAERPLLWDVYRPTGNAKRAPVVLLLHGGGFIHGHRSMMADAATAFAQRGFVAIAPEYRLIGEAAWPTPLTDVRAAIAAVGARAGELAIDPSLIFLAGYSAGAHLSLLSSAGVRAVAAFFPPSRLDSGQMRMLNLSTAEAAALTPAGYATKLPPTIIFCGDADGMTPPTMAMEIYQAVREAGGQVDLRMYGGLSHEFVQLPGMMQTTVDDVVAFFRRTVIERDSFEKANQAERQRWDAIVAEVRGASRQ